MIMMNFVLAAAVVATPMPVSKGLAPLAFFVGHCWRGEFKGRGEIDTHCFEPMFDGRHVRDRHEVTGGKAVYRGETIYSWNAQLGKVEYTYWNSLGGVSRGTMVPKQGTLDFGDETHTRADGSKLVISTLWRRAGADAYEVVSRRNDVTGDRVVIYKRVD
jgi:hypothetical protein